MANPKQFEKGVAKARRGVAYGTARKGFKKPFVVNPCVCWSGPLETGKIYGHRESVSVI
jgi:hypothetical protein